MKITENGPHLIVEADPGKFLDVYGLGIGRSATATRESLEGIREISAEEAERLRDRYGPKDAPEENP